MYQLVGLNATCMQNLLLEYLWFVCPLKVTYVTNTCADPESFVRGGPTLTGFFFRFLVDGGSEVHIPL